MKVRHERINLQYKHACWYISISGKHAEILSLAAKVGRLKGIEVANYTGLIQQHATV